MNDKGYLIEIQYSLLSREKETYLAPVESATRYTTWTKKQRKTLKGSLCSRWYPGSQGVGLHWTPLGQRLSCLYMINSSRLFNNKKDVITTLIINTGNQIRQHKILSDFFFLWSYLFEDSYAQILNKSVPIATLEFKEKI